MPEITARLRADQIVARKAADKDRTLLLGTVLASLKNRELELGHEPTDVEAVEVLRKQIKQRLDSVEQFTKAARPELAAREEYEIGVLKGYLPPEIDPEEIRVAARAAVALSGRCANTDAGPGRRRRSGAPATRRASRQRGCRRGASRCGTACASSLHRGSSR